MAEDSLRDLLERLTAFATGAANVHDKPSTIVEEVKDVLDHLARDELPAASAVLLAIDPPGALHHQHTGPVYGSALCRDGYFPAAGHIGAGV